MELYSYEEQLKNIFSKNTQHDYKNIVREMLRKMSLTEIIDSMSYFQNFDKFIYSKLCEQFNLLGYLPSENKEKLYGFKTMIEEDFSKEYEAAEISLNTGDLIAFLIGKYTKCIDNENSFLAIAFQNLKFQIIRLIKEKFPIVKSEVTSQIFIPIEKAFYVFFVDEKKIAFQKFKNIIKYDLQHRKISNYHFEHLVNAEVFFNRINLKYIPQINSVKEHFEIIFNDASTSITRKEVMDYLNDTDISNTKVPLVKLEHQNFISFEKDVIKDIPIKHVLTSFIKEEAKLEVIRNNDGQDIYLVDIFLSNISSPYSIYDDHILIRTENLLKENFNEAIMERFILLFYIFKERGYLYNTTRKIPKILAQYFKVKNFSEGTINKIYNATHQKDEKYWHLKEQLQKIYFTNQ